MTYPHEDDAAVVFTKPDLFWVAVDFKHPSHPRRHRAVTGNE